MSGRRIRTGLIAAFLVVVTTAQGGTASVTINMPFDEAYYLICDAIKWSRGDGSYMPYGTDNGSIDLKMTDWMGWSAPNSEFVKEHGGGNYTDYVLPAYIYSMDAEARSCETINVSEEAGKTHVVVDTYWEMDVDGDWVEVESNNKFAEKFADFLVKYCKNPSQYGQ
jgi:hypothetical protein